MASLGLVLFLPDPTALSIISVVLGFTVIVGSFLNSYAADTYDGMMAKRQQGASYFWLGRDVRGKFEEYNCDKRSNQTCLG
jgi:hypothetical protein